MTAPAQFVLFLSSYAPLFVVFALLNTFGSGPPSIACALVAAIGVVLAVGVLIVARWKVPPTKLQIADAQVRDGDALAYIATYLIPFAAIGSTMGREQIAIGLFFALLAVIYVRSELFYVNPLLALVGYRLFQVTTLKGASVVLITRRRFVSSNSVTMARRLGAHVHWEA